LPELGGKEGRVAAFDWRSMSSQELGGGSVDAASSGGQFDELVDELNLTSNIACVQLALNTQPGFCGGGRD